MLAWSTAALAAVDDVPRAKQLLDEGHDQQAYELLLPFETTSRDDVNFSIAFGEAALRTGHTEQARAAFERVLELEAGSIAGHLGLGRVYRALGQYAEAKIEFETVLRLDDLPPGLQQQVAIYAAAAEPYAEGRRLLGNGYGLVGYGNYHTGSVGGGPDNEPFLSLRGGGNANYELDDGFSLNASLDYRYRNYTGRSRRDDSDLRWNASGSRNFGDGNLVVGMRGRLSYRGDGIHRNDFGGYGTWTHRIDEVDQLSFGAEIRQRHYPAGPLGYRTRDIFELSASWTRSLMDGRASIELATQGGYEFNAARADGNAGFFGLSPTFNIAIVDGLDAFTFVWWQNERYAVERIGSDGDDITTLGTRNDNLLEAGGGLVWQFARQWSLNPEVLYIQDFSSVPAVEYNSVEAWCTVRFDF